MVYDKGISLKFRIVLLLKRLIITFFKKEQPYRFLTFTQATKGIKHKGVLNSPEQYNWEFFYPSTPDLPYYKALENRNDFSYYAESFRAGFFKDDVDRFKSSGLFAPLRIKISSLENGIILGNAGVLYLERTRAFIKETVLHYNIPYRYNVYAHVLNLPLKQVLPGLGVILAHPGADGGIYHFVLECLPKIKFLAKNLAHFQYVFLPGPSTPWKTKWLAFFEIPSEKVIWLDFFAHLEVEQLIFISTLMTDYQPDLRLINLFKVEETRFCSGELPVMPKEKKIWLTRKGQKTRDVLWEAEFLKQNSDFISVDFSSLTLMETIKICKEAKIIVGPHGAAFIHLLFCEANTKVVELFPDENIQPIYGRISDLRSLDYSCLIINFQQIQYCDSWNQLVEL